MKNSIIQQLKSVTTLHVDYRSGDISDRSPLNRAATILGSGATLNRDGFVPSAAGAISYADHASARQTTGCVVVLTAPIWQTATNRYPVSVFNAGGTRFRMIMLSANSLNFYTGGSSTLTISTVGKQYIATNYQDGAAPQTYLDGVFAGTHGLVSTISATAVPFYVGQNYLLNGANTEFAIKAVMEFSRNLTATEISQLYAELAKMKWPTKPFTLASRSEANNNILVDGDMEASGVTAWTAQTSTLSKQTTAPYKGTQLLRVADNGGGGQYWARQTILETGKQYRCTGKYRSNGTRYPYIYMGSLAYLKSQGTLSTSWQPFDFTFYALGVNAYFGSVAADGYVEFDDVVITRVPPKQDKNIHLEGSPISVAARGGAIGQYLENTPFQFGDATGRYSVSTDTVFGKANSKVISCSTAGLLYMPSTQAYGEFSFDVYFPNTGANNDILYMADTIGTRDATGQDGYYLRVPGNTGAVAMGESVNGTPTNKFTSTTAFTHSTWYRLKFLRTTAGDTTVYALGGTEYPGWKILPVTTGTNPFNDTSLTTSSYFVLLLAAGAKVANIVFKPLA